MLEIQTDNCTGCGLCSEICKIKAISMGKDALTGFSYPHIYQEACIDCGLCERVCPEINNVEKNDISGQKIYALIATDEKIRMASTSGGAFALLANEIIDMKGAVAGARFEDRKLKHRIVFEKKDLIPLHKSKYVQSDMREIYKDILDAAETGKKVLFCGTPCQAAAIKRYSEKKKIDNNLIIVDLICRGVPSEKALELYLMQIESEKGSIVDKIDFKDKSKGWHSIGTYYHCSNGISFVETLEESAFMNSFVGKGEDLCIRESCFNCKYKTQGRVSDLTIGDFWGIKDDGWDDNKGTSVIFVNTETGKQLMDRIKEKARIKEYTYEDVYPGNYKAFSQLSDKTKEREMFWKLIEKTDFREALKKCVGGCTIDKT